MRDIFPKWALDAGLLRDGIIYRYLKNVESILYNSSDMIGIESKSNLEYFKKYGIDSSVKIEVLNNWSSELEFFSKKSISKLIDKNKVNIVYGGNMGAAQDLLSLVELIDLTVLGDRAVIYLIGNGDQFTSIKKIIERKKISNIILMNSLERKVFLSILANADIGLVSLNEKLTSNNYPLKMIGYMQLGKPVLASVNRCNEIIELINDNNFGYASIAKDKDNFNKNLEQMISNISVRKTQGVNAKRVFDENFTVKVAFNQISSFFI